MDGDPKTVHGLLPFAGDRVTSQPHASRLVSVNMGGNCAVYGCGIHSSHKSRTSLFKFPKDPTLRKKWISFVKRTRKDFKQPLISHRICAVHFSVDSFQSGSMIALKKTVGLSTRRPLKADAVPSVLTKKCLQALSVHSPASCSVLASKEQSKRQQRSWKRNLVKVSLRFSFYFFW